MGRSSQHVISEGIRLTIGVMTPARAGPPFTETEYWRDYNIIRNDVNAAMVSCYTHRTLNHIVATDAGILEKINRNADFWRVTSFSLQTTLFIVLSRIFGP